MGLDLAVEVFQNEYLPRGAAEVDAIVTVTATGAAARVVPADAAEVIIVDTSGSMGFPASKLAAAKRATEAAVDTLRDGVWFAVVAGTDSARVVYPRAGGLVAADPRTRLAAKQAVRRLRADGGTAMGRWLELADGLFDGYAGGPRHAILLTDGENQHESPHELSRVLEAVAGRFTCDCRGVGTDWQVAELRRIAEALLGTVDIVADPEGLADDFRSVAATAMGKAVADVSLRLWTPEGAGVVLLKQVSPGLLDLTGRRVESGPRTGDYPTGAWGGAESRDYHLRVRVRPADVGDRMLASRVSLVGPSGDVLGQGRVLAVWTEDSALSTRINREVAHYTGQAELAEAIRDGLEARKAGDVGRATAKLGRAVRLAHESGNTDTAKLLAGVVDVEDPGTGTVKLRARVADADEMTLDTRSTVTKRVRKG
ncbi:von Willebrand factor type A domain-containing protein [Saccharothrix carnea]|uniref:von Willebrand factor type A domain-containing protein n=1 Tax=Saccharothrix carnea TaxID=1280637 RepID=A0A2P8IGH0_SACCR|nr:VWA domain-containing protein [Saccharothrix carnea]PSL57566.1 von Willebrand factor type A domain-containing protein [Saccharothrix carnea]